MTEYYKHFSFDVDSPAFGKLVADLQITVYMTIDFWFMGKWFGMEPGLQVHKIQFFIQNWNYRTIYVWDDDLESEMHNAQKKLLEDAKHYPDIPGTNKPKP